MSRLKCPRRNCGEFMDPITDGNGRVALVCEACSLNRRGLCRTCKQPTTATKAPFPMRCDVCRRRHHNIQSNTRKRGAYRGRRRQKLLAKMRKKYRTNAEFRTRKIAAANARHMAHPRTDIDRAYDRQVMRKWRADQRSVTVPDERTGEGKNVDGYALTDAGRDRPRKTA